MLIAPVLVVGIRGRFDCAGRDVRVAAAVRRGAGQLEAAAETRHELAESRLYSFIVCVCVFVCVLLLLLSFRFVSALDTDQRVLGTSRVSSPESMRVIARTCWDERAICADGQQADWTEVR